MLTTARSSRPSTRWASINESMPYDWAASMADIVGGIGISHTPSMGMEFDKATQNGAWSANWEPWFRGTRPVRRWLEELAPEALGIDVTPKLKVLKTAEPPGRSAGVKVASAAELVQKLKVEAGVI